MGMGLDEQEGKRRSGGGVEVVVYIYYIISIIKLDTLSREILPPMVTCTALWET